MIFQLQVLFEKDSDVFKLFSHPVKHQLCASKSPSLSHALQLLQGRDESHHAARGAPADGRMCDAVHFIRRARSDCRMQLLDILLHLTQLHLDQLQQELFVTAR